MLRDVDAMRGVGRARPRVTKQMPGRSTSLALAIAIIAAPASCRQIVTFSGASCIASSAAR